MKLMLPSKTVWEKNSSLRKALGIEEKVAPIISVVGAGGKTSTIEYLAKEYEALGKQVIVTTTTHMFRPTNWTWCREQTMEIVDKYLEKETVLWIGLPCGDEKMMSPDLAFLKQLKERILPILIEADGAKRLPFKFPGEREPVILEGSHMVIGVLGMDALGKPLKEVCFRFELAAEYLHKSDDEVLTEDDYVEVIKSNYGLKKGVAQGMDYIVILNKVDNATRQEQAIRIRAELLKNGIQKVFITSFL
jgi:probable selenium-dependent hydroxylase accessory protein YqeC